MLPAILSFVWTSGPLMNAAFTILFLVFIRLWTRADISDSPSSSITKPIAKIGEKIEETRKEVTEGLTRMGTAESNEVNKEDTVETSVSHTNHLDALFFGELFVAGFAAGFLIKYGW